MARVKEFMVLGHSCLTVTQQSIACSDVQSRTPWHIYLCWTTEKARCRVGGIHKPSVVDELPDGSEGSRCFQVGIISWHTSPESINCKNNYGYFILSLAMIVTREDGLVQEFRRTPSRCRSWTSHESQLTTLGLLI